MYHDEFGWFDTTNPSALNPLFLGVGDIGEAAHSSRRTRMGST